jgi:hypothetical protein
MEGKYSIELFREGGESSGIERILLRHDSLTAARVLYKAVVLNYAERLIMLCDKARIRTAGAQGSGSGARTSERSAAARRIA